MTSSRLLLLAGFAASISTFRGPLIRALCDVGAEVAVGAPGVEELPKLHEELASIGVVLHDIPLQRTGANPVADIGLLVSLYRLMRTVRPTIILPYTIKPVIYGTIAAWLARVPRRYALVTGLGYAFTGTRQGLVTLLVRMLYRFALRRTHKVFFQNPDDERLFRQLGLLPANIPSVVVNGSGVDVTQFSSHPLPEGAPVFLMIARLLGDKGVREYAEAARKVKHTNPGTVFQLVGWIDSNPDAIAQAELDGWIAEGAIDFLGRLDDVRHAVAGSSVYVLPSYREGTPRTVLEAMAMGRPIITTDAPGCRETVMPGENGFLVPVQSVDALADAMLRFIQEPGLIQRMGLRSREIVEEKYDVNKVNAVMLREMGLS
ncbi:MAG: glycosyltransferase family 4 protein [Pseudomonadota bacterium]